MKKMIRSFGRITSLCRKEYVENRSRMLLKLLCFFCIILALLSLKQYDSIRHAIPFNSKDAILQVCFIYSAIFIGSTNLFMKKMSTKTGRINLLMLPASIKEKFISQWTVNIFLFIVTMPVIVSLEEFIRVILFKLFYNDKMNLVSSIDWNYLMAKGVDNGPFKSSEVLFPAYQYFLLFVTAILFLQSMYMIGTLVWSKSHFIKTSSFLLITGLACIFTIGGGISIISKYRPYKNTIIDNDSFLNSPENISLLISIILIILTIVNYVLAYYRFKESEVINRM